MIIITKNNNDNDNITLKNINKIGDDKNEKYKTKFECMIIWSLDIINIYDITNEYFINQIIHHSKLWAIPLGLCLTCMTAGFRQAFIHTKQM